MQEKTGRTADAMMTREERRLENYREELDEGQRRSFDEFRRYLTAHKPLTPMTLYHYLREYRNYLKSAGADLSQSTITSYASHKKYPMNPVRRAMLLLLCEWHVHMLLHPHATQYEDQSLTDRLSLITTIRILSIPKASSKRRKEKRFLNDEQVAAWVRRLREAQEVPSWYLPLLLLLSDSGMRIGEALSIKKKDLKGTSIIVRVKGNTKKSKRIRPETLEVLNEYAKAEKRKVDDFLFSEENGEPLNQPNVRYYFSKYSVGGGVHPHMLRRYVASKLHRMRVETIIIKEILGHASMSTTQQYIQVDPEQVKAAQKAYHEDIKW